MLCALALWSATIFSAQARLVNITIDDQHGDFRMGHLVTYNQQWRAISAGSHSEIYHPLYWAHVYNNTLHAAVSDGHSELQIVFEGSGIYVYFTFFTGATTTNLTFSLDHGNDTVSDVFPRVLSTKLAEGYYIYRELVFWRGNLDHGPHHILVQTHSSPPSPDDKSSWAYAMFDYAVYTRDVDHVLTMLNAGASPVPERRSVTDSNRFQRDNILTICASAGGTALLIAAAAWYLYKRRKQLRRSAAATQSPIALTPYPIPSSPSRARRLEPPAAPKIRFEKRISVAQAAVPAEAPRASRTVEGLQAELERVLEENEILRQAAAPPPCYSDGARSEHA